MSNSSSRNFSAAHQQITLAGARHVIALAHEQARHFGVSIGVAVVDRSGELVAFERDDNAALVTTHVAVAKARTAALLRAPSKMFEDFVNSGLPSFLATPGITPLQGGVPLMLENEVIGAVGVSGGSGEQDVAIATSAAAVLSSR
ncbi:GlcG/HbpS family heme-binding protein [Paraburkholderia tropica]|uniref:GlcG/HbpS family heme-binding protein n=1 Tax=Paraburkholderia tropica TaxID=92647 RepID=UPI002AB7922E|nr:heme-binding protein [Paraburkholderia tropica]